MAKGKSSGGKGKSSGKNRSAITGRYISNAASARWPKSSVTEKK